MKNRWRKELEDIKPYVPGKPIAEVQQELGIDDVIKLASNENPCGPSPAAQAAIIAMAAHAHIYPDGSAAALKRRLAAHCQVAADQIILGNGSDEVFKFVGEAFLHPGDEVVMAKPTFSEYAFVARLMGAESVEVPLQDFKHDLGKIAAAVNDRTRVVFVCNPNNPTGTALGRREMTDFVQVLPADVLLVIDEAYYEYVQDPDFPKSIDWLDRHENVLITRTFSKAYGLAALRIGYGLGHANLIRVLEKVREPFNVNTVAQKAALASLDDLEHVQASVAVNEAGKEYLYGQLQAMGLEFVPTETNFILIAVRRDAVAVFEALLRRGVIIRPAHVFGMPQHIRVTIGTESQNQRFVTALKEVLAGENSH